MKTRLKLQYLGNWTTIKKNTGTEHPVSKLSQVCQLQLYGAPSLQFDAEMVRVKKEITRGCSCEINFTHNNDHYYDCHKIEAPIQHR